jgi:hypothetical protein
MGKAFLSKSNGGGGLAFRVLGNPAPATPKPNDIWVDTDDKITSYIFDAIEPKGYAEGMLWFRIDTYSPVAFNAIKKEQIQVYPLEAKQYINGAWVKKTAKSYQNGAWVEWITYVIQNGKVNAAIVDGFTAYAYRPSTSSATATKPTVSIGSGIKLDLAGTRGGSYFSNSKINLSKYKTLKVHVASAHADDDSTYIRIGESASKENNYTVGEAKTICSNGEMIADKVISLDISSVNTSRYIFVSLYGTGAKSITFTDIWLE